MGAGGWGKNHVRNYAALPDADLRYICDRHEGIRESMTALYPSASFPEAVSATGSCYLQSECGVEDVVFATLHYPDERMAHDHVSWLDPHKTRKLTVVGGSGLHVVRALEGGSASLAQGGARIELRGGR